ncbi:MAG TPA: serine kinase [Candidatus Hydrogenedentes bacterium]|nr:serine kinase [Candidatus Hydrogenedentota bacterium]
MNLAAIVNALELENLTPEIDLDTMPDIRCGYASDLLSDVLAHAPRGGVLITVQVHLNVIAVSVHAELAAVIFALGRRPDDATRARAAQEGVCLLASQAPAFEIVGKLYELGLRGVDA